MAIQEIAQSYRLEGNNGKAVLLIHGYTGTPGELRPLGEYLNALGYTVLGVRLPGHGTSVDDLEKTTAEDWYREAARGAESLFEEFQEVFVAGLSMGGIMAIRVAASFPVKAAAIMSAPIFLPDKRIAFYPILKYFIRSLPKSKKHYGNMMKYNVSYETMPTKPLGSLFATIKKCKQEYLKKIKCPTIVLQSKVEHTVVPKSAQYIFDSLGTAEENKKLIWLEKSGHIISLDVEREFVFKEIADFFAQASDKQD